MKRKLQIFVSSTYKDLLDERQAAVSAILKAGHIPAGMELFAAGDESQWQTIKRWIEGSDIYMLILGRRYGSLEPKSKKSYTELEYDYAVSLKKPHFAVVIKEEASREQPASELDQRKKLKKFRAKVLRKTSSFFADAKDIKLAIHESIRDLENRSKAAGWVSAADMPDLALLKSEIRKLKKDNQQLINKLEKFQNQNSWERKQDKERESLKELVKVLETIQVETSVFSGDKSKTNEYSLSKLLWHFRGKFVHGITAYLTDPIDRFLYYSVCPKLQIHGVMENKGRLQRFYLSKKGEQLVAHMEREELNKSKQE